MTTPRSFGRERSAPLRQAPGTLPSPPDGTLSRMALSFVTGIAAALWAMSEFGSIEHNGLFLLIFVLSLISWPLYLYWSSNSQAKKTGYHNGYMDGYMDCAAIRSGSQPRGPQLHAVRN